MHDHQCHHGREKEGIQAGGTTNGLYDRITSAARWLWFLVVKNRVAIAIASLIWLVWRSGTQPRRLAYPCQQAAAANLGFIAVLFIPGLARLKAKQAATARQRALALATGSVCLAGLLFVLVSGGVAVYSEYWTAPAAETESATEGTGIPATVSIIKNAGWDDDAILEQMVRDAVALSGGLEPIMVDVRGGGSAPWTTGDGDVDVIIIPNVFGDGGEYVYPGITTDIRIIKTVVDLAWEAGANSVKIGGAGTGDNWTAFQSQGYDTNGDHLFDYDTRVALIDLNDTGTTGACAGLVQYNNVTKITLPSSGSGAGVIRNDYWVHNELLKTDAMIVVPCLKNHNLGTITVGMKMRIGTAPQDIYFAPWLGCGDAPWLRWEMHNRGTAGTRFPATIGGAAASEEESVQRSFIDLNLVRPHDFVVVDARVGNEQGPGEYNEPGPGVGPNPAYRVHSVMAGSDTVAVDAIAALVMGYDPDRIPFLTMANNTNVLGVKDRRIITVLGDHVQDVRVDFDLSHPKGYAQPYRAESVSPAIGDISLFDGQTIVLDAPLTVSVTGVSDNVGVIKAELAMKRADGENLLVNGGFETGDSTGWTTYHSAWGNNSGDVDFASTETGHVGNGALHLSLAAGEQDSFAVYQEVPTTPGKAYRIDAMWKANKYGRDTWYEVMLIDGPWSAHQGDTGGADVLLNHMYAYDLNASANCPSGNEIPASFDWTWTHDMNDDPVDNCWNDRDGVRVASGNTMTVVLKTGSCCGTNRSDVWFDEVSLVEVSNEEFVVATVTDPGSNFDIVWDPVDLPLGFYEARVSVYDAMMNEASITRNVELIWPQTPVIGLDAAEIEQTIFVGDACVQDTFGVANIGINTLSYSVSWNVSWMSVSPVFGSSTGYPANRHTIRYNCARLSPGTHVGTVSVSGNAFNSPQKLKVRVNVMTIPPDFDTDGDVDQTDFGHMQKCLTGPGVPQVNPNCQNADLDDDGDVDINDFGILQGCMTGAKVIVDPTCMD